MPAKGSGDGLRRRAGKGNPDEPCPADERKDDDQPRAVQKSPQENNWWTAFLDISQTSAFFIIFCARAAAALYVPIQDCDEVFNYWEPLHFLMHGHAAQTWEYGPQFGLRSYAYVILHLCNALTFQWVHSPAVAAILANPVPKVATFYFVRLSLALVSAGADAALYGAIRSRCGSMHRGRAFLCLVFLASSSGLIMASSGFLPSSFCMYFISFATAAILYADGSETGRAHPDYAEICIGCVVAAVLLGWPFVGLVSLTMAILLLRHYSFLGLVWITIKYTAGVSVVIFWVDSIFYGKVTFPPLNIVMYNVFGEGGDSTLYGTEAWWFYLANLTLNFNAGLPLFVCGPVLHFIRWITSQQILKDLRGPKSEMTCMAHAYVWLVFMSLQAHKEERFMFVVYPLIAVSAGLALDDALSLCSAFASAAVGPRLGKRFANLLAFLAICTVLLLSLSRICLLVSGFSAPFNIFAKLSMELTQYGRRFGLLALPVNVCVGKEWYRFPSSFFMDERPGASKSRLRYLKSEFSGQLPGFIQVQPPGVTSGLVDSIVDLVRRTVRAAQKVNPTFNSENKEVFDRYIDESECHFLVDLVVPGQTEKHYEMSKDWEVVHKEPFLDLANSKFPWKTFYVPGISTDRNRYSDYLLLRSTKTVMPLPRAKR